MAVPDLPGGCRYELRDAVDALSEYDEEAAAVFLDDAWARPQRAQQFGVEYDTHPFDGSQSVRDHIDTSISTTEIIDAAFDALTEGGWLIADADDWLTPRLIDYLREEYGDVAATYDGGGFRRLGGVTYVSCDGTPDRSTAGMYLTNGGYPVVFAHKGETNRRSSASARQLAERVREDFGWGSVKPIEPYYEWVTGLIEQGELVLVPCAGTAPAAIATEQAFGEDARYVCVDIEPGAREAFNRRREQWFEKHEQRKLQ